MLFNYFSIKQPTGLEPILERWGVNVGDDVVHDPKNTIHGQDVIVYNFSKHPVVNPLTGLALQLILPRPVSAADWKNPPADAPKVDELVFSSPQIPRSRAIPPPRRAVIRSWSPSNKKPSPASPARAAPRAWSSSGDSFFLGNHQIDSGANRDFAGYAANWLLDRTTLLEGIGPRPVTEFRLMMTRAQQQNVRWLLLGALPGAVLLFGGLRLACAQKIMNSKTTGIWFVVAATLFAFIFDFQQHYHARRPISANILAGLQPSTVTSIQVIPAGALEIRADRTNGDWFLSKPIVLSRAVRRHRSTARRAAKTRARHEHQRGGIARP